jgi:hypothetical protein
MPASIKIGFNFVDKNIALSRMLLWNLWISAFLEIADQFFEDEDFRERS